jgi:hypothetical protein
VPLTERVFGTSQNYLQAGEINYSNRIDRSKIIQLALKTHPDKNPGDPEATERFQELSAAYNLLQKHLDPSYENNFNEDCDYDIFGDSDDEEPLDFYLFVILQYDSALLITCASIATSLTNS